MAPAHYTPRSNSGAHTPAPRGFGNTPARPQETDDMVPIAPIQLDDSTIAAAQLSVQNLTTFTVRI